MGRTIRASSALHRPRSSPGTSGRGRCCAWRRRGNRSGSHRSRTRWPTGGPSCGCREDCAGSRNIRATIRRPVRRRAGVAPAALASHALVRGGRGRGDQGDRRCRDAGARVVAPADLPLPASPARRGPGCAPTRTSGRAAPDDRGHGSSGLVGSALCATSRPAATASSGWCGGRPMVRSSGPGIRSDRPARWRESMPSSILPGRPSPAVSPRRTNGWCATAVSVPPRSWPVSWPPCRTGRGSCCLARPSATTGANGDEADGGTRVARGSWRTVEDGRRQRSPPSTPACEWFMCGPPSSSRPGASLKLLRPSSRSASEDRSLRGPWVSWIRLDELLDVFGRALADDQLVGPLNVVAPSRRHQRDYAPTLARVIAGRPSSGSRRSAPRAPGREGPREMVQASQRVPPPRLDATGHVFRLGLETCLRHQLGHMDVATYGDESRNIRGRAEAGPEVHMRPPRLPAYCRGDHRCPRAGPCGRCRRGAGVLPRRARLALRRCTRGVAHLRNGSLGARRPPDRRGPSTMRSRSSATTSSRRSPSSRPGASSRGHREPWLRSYDRPRGPGRRPICCTSRGTRPRSISEPAAGGVTGTASASGR